MAKIIWTNFENLESGLDIRNKINKLGNDVADNLNTKTLQFINISVPTTAWVADTTYKDYPFRASIALTGVLSTDVPYVMFAPAQQESGNFIGASTYDGGIYIYTANPKPVTNIIIPNIQITRLSI